MSDQNWPPRNADDDNAVPPERPVDPTTPADQSSSAPFGSDPGPADYNPPAQDPNQPPASGYAPSPADPYGQSPAAGYQTPYPQAGGPYGQQPPSDPYAQPPAPGYGQQPAGYPPAPPPYSAGPTPTPVPAVGGAPLADWPKRALGGLIDYVAPGIVIGVVTGIIGNIAGSGIGNALSTLLGIGWFVYLGYKSGTTGVTFGRSIAKTKLIGEATGAPIGVSNGIIRQFAHIIDSIICYIGWLFPLWDSKRQTIADKVMKTVVIDNSGDPNASNYDWNVTPPQR